MLRMFGSYDIAFEGSVANYLLLCAKFFFNCFFLFSVLSSILSILFISTGSKLQGGVSVIVSIFIISIMCSAYPACVKYLNHNKMYTFLFGEDIKLSGYGLDTGKIYNNGGSFIYAKDIYGYDYREVNILEDYEVMSASYATGVSTSLRLIDVDVLDLRSGEKKHYEDYRYIVPPDSRTRMGILMDIFFAIPLIDCSAMIFTFFINESIPIYVYPILFVSLFILLTGFYTLGAALSAVSMRFQNMTISVVVYIGFIMLLYFGFNFISRAASIPAILNAAGALKISLLMLIGSFISNGLAFLVHFLFRFDKYYK